MNLQQLRYFLAAVEHGSFSAAADALHLAPPSVSEPIRRLEGELGLVLFERDRRRLRLTDAGTALVPRARHVLRALDEAGQAMGDLRDLRGGVANFGLFRNADYYDLEGLADQFLAAHPGMRLRLFGQNSAEVATAVRAGRAEAGLVVLPVPDDEQLALRPVLRDEVLYVSADERRTRRRIDLRRLCESPLVLYDAHYAGEDPTRRQLSERVQQEALALDPVLEVERVEGALRCVRAGLGDSIVAGSVLRAAAPDLHAVGLEVPLYDTIAVVTRRGAQLSPATRAFLDVAERRIAALAAGSPTAELVTG
jgi:DNA-binding transcriptional LysR family regulator